MKIPCHTPRWILSFTRREAFDSDLSFPPCSQGYHKIDTSANTSNTLRDVWHPPSKMGKELATQKHSCPAIPAGHPDAQGFASEQSPYSQSHGLHSWHLSAPPPHPPAPNSRIPSGEWLLLLARLHQAASSSAEPYSYHSPSRWFPGL